MDKKEPKYLEHPFSQIGQHLDFREKAKGNPLVKRLSEAGGDSKTSKFRMLALGPLFPEQEFFEASRRRQLGK
jgi:hypothetical protein